MKLRPIKADDHRDKALSHLSKPDDKAKLILFMMKSLGYSEVKATRLAGL